MEGILRKENGNYNFYLNNILFATTSKNKIEGISEILSLNNCLEIESGYDIIGISRAEAEKCSPKDRHKDISIWNTLCEEDAELIKIGILKAFELLKKEDRYSEEDIMEAFSSGEDCDRYRLGSILSKKESTKWKVKVVTEPMNLDEIKASGKGFLNADTRKIKKDSSGSLILKRI